MTPDNDPISARLNALIAEYRSHLPERLQLIERLYAALRQNPADWPSMEALHLTLHKLAGSGATFGYSELGKQARLWENILHPLIESRTPPSSQKCDEMHCFLQQLLQAAATPDEN